MPRYAPLPTVSIDPRNEAQIVRDASQRVYQASNQTLNDFSAGNPLAALLEGQAFAQGEFLFWANQLPQKILIEWIGPFLGAMRRLGTPSVARVLITIDPSDTIITVAAGTRINTSPNLTGGESFSFLLNQDAIFSPGETFAFASVTSEYVGSIYNVPAGAINSPGAISIPGLVITNPQPATGGSDVETFNEVQERFFTLIRRRNPVSETDWENFFIDLYGLGTLTSVQPNRPTPGPYNYLKDYLQANGQISFFVLGPNGVELTNEQLLRGQKIVNFSTPVELKAHLYPMTLSQVQYSVKMEINANGPYFGDMKTSALSFRDSLSTIFTPGVIYPASSPPSISEIDAAFYATIPSTTRYVDPNIIDSAAYNTPVFVHKTSATYSQVRSFEPTQELLSVNDLVETTLPAPIYFPVIEAFTPYSSSKKDQTIYGNLTLKQVKQLTAGVFFQGDVVTLDSNNAITLHIVLDNINIASSAEILKYVAQGRISPAKQISPWVEGNTYKNATGNLLDPDLIAYDYAADEFIPEGSGPIHMRVGALIWYVTKNFTLGSATNDLTGAVQESKLGIAITVEELEEGQSYTAGQWVKTAQVGSGPNQQVDPNYFYVDTSKGAVTKYAYVETNFTYSQGELTVSEYFEELTNQGLIKTVSLFNGDKGLPIYKYKPRFQAGEYLEYRKTVNSSPLYFTAAKFFTPNTSQIQPLIDQGLVIPIATTDANRVKLSRQLIDGSIRTPVKMFTFFEGEQTYFRDGSDIKTYIALQSVSPIFDFYVYLENKVFESVDNTSMSNFVLNPVYIPYYNPKYALNSEDVIVSEDGKNYYRVMTAFTPPQTTTGWSGVEALNTTRYEEYAGNLLRIVRRYECNDEILSQLGKDVSAIKLGVADITLIPRNVERSNSDQQYTYVLENTNSASTTPELSWYTGTKYQYRPPNYGNGTLSL